MEFTSLNDQDKLDIFLMSASNMGISPQAIEKDYNDMEEMFFAEVPSWHNLLAELEVLENTLNT